jgi:hypothetical protein
VTFLRTVFESEVGGRQFAQNCVRWLEKIRDSLRLEPVIKFKSRNRLS